MVKMDMNWINLRLSLPGIRKKVVVDNTSRMANTGMRFCVIVGFCSLNILHFGNGFKSIYSAMDAALLNGRNLRCASCAGLKPINPPVEYTLSHVR